MPHSLHHQHVIVMGVSGCGKSSLAQAIAQHLAWPMIEGDDYHPAANLAKMSAGQALSDSDRAPWLATLNTKLRSTPQAVLACSALKASYRQCLRAGITAPLFVHCAGNYEALHKRMAQRQHFMPATLLESQFAALELPSPELEPGLHCLTIDTSLPLESALAQVLMHLQAPQFPPQ